MKRRTDSISYLAVEARRAHLNGNIAALRQYCALALFRVIQSKLPLPSLGEMMWAFTFIYQWQKDDSYWIHRAAKIYLDDKVQQETNPELISILKVLDSAVGNFDWSHKTWKNNFRILSLFSTSFLNACKKIEDISLFAFVVEIFWFIPADKSLWFALSETWGKKLDNGKNPELASIINQCKSRLLMQMKVLCLINKEFKCKLTYSGEVCCDSKFVDAWNRFFGADWQGLHASIELLSKTINIKSDEVLSYYSFLNISRLFRNDAISPPVLGALRNKTVSYGRQQYITQLERQILFDESLLKAQLQGRGGGDWRAKMLRLMVVSELEALRRWNIGDYIAWVRRERDLYLELALSEVREKGSSVKNTGYFVGAIKAAIRSLEPGKFQGKDIKVALAHIEISEDHLNYIKTIINTIISSAPIEWPYAVEIMEALTDAMPSDMLSKVAKWSKAVEVDNRKKYMQVLTTLKFWEDIFKWCEVSTDVYFILDHCFRKLFMQHAAWGLNTPLLEIALSKSPTEIATKWCRCLLSVGAKNDNYAYAIKLIYNASLEKIGLKPYAKEYAALCLEEHPMDGFVKRIEYMLSISNEDDVKYEKCYREEYLSELNKWLKQIIDRDGKGITTGGFFPNPQELSKFDFRGRYSKEARNLCEALMQCVEAEFSTRIEIANCIEYLYFLSQSVSKSIVRIISRRMIKWAQKDLKGFEVFPSSVSPFNTFVYTENAPSPSAYSIGVLSNACWAVLGKRDKIMIVKNVLRELGKECKGVAGWYLSLFLKAAESGDEELTLLSVAGVAELLSSVSGEESLVDMLHHLYGALCNKNSSYKYMLPIMQILEKWMIQQSKSLSPIVRQYAARLLRFWETNIRASYAVREAITRLSGDSRGRVRFELQA